MAEYIDANKKVTIQVYDDMTEEWHKEKVTIAEALDKWTDEGCPKPVVIPIKHGRWNKVVHSNNSITHYCSECGSIFNKGCADLGEYNYCPNCGAKMGGKE